MATGHGLAGWRGSQPFECQAPPPQQPQRQSGMSASDLLQSYMDKFALTQHAAPPPPPLPAGSGRLEKPPALAQLPLTMEPDRDTLDLLFGDGDRRLTCGSQFMSVGTRRILRDVDRQLDHLQPCYSAPDKLELRTMWPNMHEHMERRWRQQLRTRYEAQQVEAAATSAAAKAAQGSRADMYGSRHRRAKPPPRCLSPIQPAVRTDHEDDEDEDEDTEKEESNEDDEVVPCSSLAEATARSEDEEEEEEAESGRPWGSDSGVGLSCLGVGGDVTRSDERPEAAAAAAIDHKSAADEAAASDHRNFEERMRSYRCVLEAHELSAQLRQRLEVACAAGGSGARALTADQKGHIRERLARLQHPCPPVPAAEGAQPPQEARQEDWHEQQQERITTERLSRLMNGARSLLAEDDDRGPTTGRRRLCDSLAASQQELQRQQQQYQRQPKQQSLHDDDSSS